MDYLGSIPFIDAAGGPFIAIPSSAVSAWEGADPPRDGRVIDVSWQYDPTGPATDYDRACASSDMISPLTVGHDQALVVHGASESIGWVPLGGGASGGIFITLLSVDDKKRLGEEVHRLTTVDFGPAILRWELREPGARLIHAAESGASVRDDDVLELDLPAGSYEVQVMHYKERGIAEMVLHKLVVAGTSRPTSLPKNDTAAAMARTCRFLDAAARFSLDDWTRIHSRYLAGEGEYWKSTCALDDVGTSAAVHNIKTLTREEQDERSRLRGAVGARKDAILAALPERREMDGKSVHFRPCLRGILTNTLKILWSREQVMERPDRLAAARQYLTLYDELVDFPEISAAS